MAIVVQSRVLLEKLWVLYTPSFGVIICFLARGCWLGLSFELYRFARWSLYELDLLRDVPWMCNYFRFDWVSNWHEKCWADKSHNRTLVYIKRQWCLIVFQLSASTHWCLVPFLTLTPMMPWKERAILVAINLSDIPFYHFWQWLGVSFKSVNQLR